MRGSMWGAIVVGALVVGSAWAGHVDATEVKTPAVGAEAPDLAIVFTTNHCPTAQAYEDRLIRLTADYKGTVRIADAKTVYLRLTPGYFEPQTLVIVLGRMLREGAQ
ncbi:hypothetical protein [Anaerobaca lacustris]|uniref:Glutaredoxin domain-containing protein n=1 Tax=Anaerobaca lacustris TaxID=3044600 RepID=A0AAW6TYS0_9BACT|nr:hypothetical protein [Sedimentisphaerales bacterium M17dextr]